MIGILIIAHAPLASALRDCALHVYPECASGVQALDILPNASPDESLLLAKVALSKLNTTEVLMLSDVFGATPSNVAQKLNDGIDGTTHGANASNLPAPVQPLDSLNPLRPWPLFLRRPFSPRLRS